MSLTMLPSLLLPWYEKNRRDLPWRRDREPYHIWLSEIMLQQTRVEAVRGYYARFLAALPDIPALACCDDERLHKLWEGLGYYTRVKNLKKAAIVVMERHGGVFPDTYEAVRALPGIGDYTAGAILSICFGAATPAVDGNVLRVITRLTASRDSISHAKTKRKITEQLKAIYPPGRCGDFTQALMELGAVVCVPNGVPDCAHCPAASICQSREGELFRQIPVRDEKKPRKYEQKTVLLLCCDGRTAIRKRAASGLLAGLWEFPNVEGHHSAQETLDLASAWGCRPRDVKKSVGKTHVFTHITWDMIGYYVDCDAMPSQFYWASQAELDRDFSLPTAFRQFRDE